MRAIILLFANILFSSIPGKYHDNAESFAINKYTSERGRKCQSYKMSKSSKISAAHFERRDRNDRLNGQTLDGTDSISRLVELYQIGTNKGTYLDELFQKFGTKHGTRLDRLYRKKWRPRRYCYQATGKHHSHM